MHLFYWYIIGTLFVEMAYEYEKYVATLDTLVTTLDTFGVAILPGVLDATECQQMNDGMWDTLKHTTSGWDTPITHNNPKSWRSFRYLFAKHSMLIQNWQYGHAQYVWDIRQNPKVVAVYSKIWDCAPENLLVSFDGIAVHMPPESTKLGWYRQTWYHCDQNFADSTFKCVQSWVTGYDVNEGDATLAFMEHSNKYHASFQERFQIQEKGNWHKLEPEQERYFVEECGCMPKRIKCPRGSMVLWDSRTIHCGTEAMKTRAQPNFRNVVYVCYEPRVNCTEKKLVAKQKALANMRMTSHWPCEVTLFSKNPRTYSSDIVVPTIEPLAPPKLTDLGKRLAGLP
jgi:ectoine hydroxylase-related dioxygenase (phytanoyl-CoA dioxygenase family)